MTLKWGSTTVTAVKWGSTTCSVVKWGSTKVWPDQTLFNNAWVWKYRQEYKDYTTTNSTSMVNGHYYAKVEGLKLTAKGYFVTKSSLHYAAILITPKIYHSGTCTVTYTVNTPWSGAYDSYIYLKYSASLPTVGTNVSTNGLNNYTTGASQYTELRTAGSKTISCTINGTYYIMIELMSKHGETAVTLTNFS